MTEVTKIDWRIKTGAKWWSGTDSQLKMEIWRDGHMLKRLNVEPGNTGRLDRATDATYYWVFENTSNIGVSYSGFTPPFTERFPNGVRGHLKVKFIAMGDDAWEKDEIESTVYSGVARHVPGTIDSLVWQEDWETFFFGQDVVLSTDSREGHRTWTLNY
jgi:hypothetical protein